MCLLSFRSDVYVYPLTQLALILFDQFCLNTSLNIWSESILNPSVHEQCITVTTAMLLLLLTVKRIRERNLLFAGHSLPDTQRLGWTILTCKTLDNKLAYRHDVSKGGRLECHKKGCGWVRDRQNGGCVFLCGVDIDGVVEVGRMRGCNFREGWKRMVCMHKLLSRILWYATTQQTIRFQLRFQKLAVI